MKRGIINYQQGMLLKPQHFQLERLMSDERLVRTVRMLQPYCYGVQEIDISQDSLSNMSVSLTVGHFVFLDGSEAVLGENAYLSAKSIPSDMLENGMVLPVYIGLKRFDENGTNLNIFEDEISSDCDCRYVGNYGGEEINDLYGTSVSGNVELMQYNLRIFLGEEIRQISNYELIKIAEVYRDGTRILLNSNYVPPLVNFFDSRLLVNIMNDISAMLLSKTRMFEKYKHIRFSQQQSAYEIMLINMISVLCDCAAEVQTLQSIKQAHPVEVWRILSRVVSILSSCTEELSAVDQGRRFPEYNHDDLYGVFSLLQQQLRICLGSLSVGPEYVIRFIRGDNSVWYADIPDLGKLGQYEVYLSMSGTELEPDKLSLSFWRQLKLSSADSMNDLIVRSLSGIPIMIIESIPGGLPKLDHGFYSTVDVHNNMWFDIVNSHKAAMLWDAPEDGELIMYITRN